MIIIALIVAGVALVVALRARRLERERCARVLERRAAAYGDRPRYPEAGALLLELAHLVRHPSSANGLTRAQRHAGRRVRAQLRARRYQ